MMAKMSPDPLARWKIEGRIDTGGVHFVCSNCGAMSPPVEDLAVANHWIGEHKCPDEVHYFTCQCGETVEVRILTDPNILWHRMYPWDDDGIRQHMLTHYPFPKA